MEARPEDRKKKEAEPSEVDDEKKHKKQSNGVPDGGSDKKQKRPRDRKKKQDKAKQKKKDAELDTADTPPSDPSSTNEKAPSPAPAPTKAPPHKKQQQPKKKEEDDNDNDADTAAAASASSSSSGDAKEGDTKKKKKQRDRNRERKDKQAKAATATAMAGLVVKDPRTGGPVEYSVGPMQSRSALIAELFAHGDDSVASLDVKEPSLRTSGSSIESAIDSQAMEFDTLPARRVHLWPETTMELAFVMQHVDQWTETTAYSSGKKWDVNTPIRLPGIKEQIDIPLRNAYYEDDPVLAAATGLRSGQPTRNLVVIHSVKCTTAVSENMHTDLSAVFCALKPVTLSSRYPPGSCYGRDFQYDVRMIEKTFGNNNKRAATANASSKATEAMAAAVTSSESDTPFDVAQSTVMELADLPMFASTSDKYMAWMQKKSSENTGSSKKQQTTDRDAAHWDTRLPNMDLSLFVNRHFMQDVFDSPYNGVLPLPHSSESARDHWRAIPTIPVMRKPGAKGDEKKTRPVVFMRTPAVGMCLPQRKADVECRNHRMYTNNVLMDILKLDAPGSTDVRKAQAKTIRDQITSSIAVDMNAEMVTAVRAFADAKRTIDAYLADIKSSTPSAPSETPTFDATVRSRIEDYSRYRVVFDTRKDFRQFRCWMDQYAYLMWKSLVAAEAKHASSAAVAAVAATVAAESAATATQPAAPVATAETKDGASPQPTADSSSKSPQVVETRSFETAIRSRAYVREGPFVVVSVRRDLLFEYASRVCAASQTEVVDLNTAHLTLYPHEPMDVIADRLKPVERSAHPILSVRVSVSLTHVSC